MELYFYYKADGKTKFYFTIDKKHSEAWKRFFLECGGDVQKSDYEYFLTTIK